MPTQNPFQLVRRKLMLSTRGVEGLAVSTVARIEAGHYEQLSDGMVDAIAKAVKAKGVDFGVIATELEKRFGTDNLGLAYERWRRQHRAETGDSVLWPSPEKIERVSAGRGEAPMLTFCRLIAGNVPKFCSALCLQKPTVDRYIKGEFNYLNPPDSIKQALSDAGYTDSEQLFELQRKWIDEGAL